MAINQFAHHTHNPKLSHYISINITRFYLKGTRYYGLIFKLINVLNLGCYIDTDFIGL